ncbi:MAG TPA: APC family permease [Trebonia sp.]|jgi:amino acid transporter|nr:APC family permease [Trebonia sp.]
MREPARAPGDEAEDAQTRAGEDRHLRRSLGYWQLTAVGFSGVIGSGWLLGAMYAAQAAGPEAIVSWVIGGGVLALIALVMAELGGARPEAGGLVRWPFYSNGRLVATIAGWGIWIAWATNPPSESAAMIQYMSKYVPGIFNGTSLTPLGVLLGAGIMAVFVLVNWFGIQLFARVNGALTVAKFVVPAITVIALFASGFHSGNFTSHGGFAPYGWAPGLSAIATAGVIYAYTGFQGPIDLSGEAKNPRRDVPRAVVSSLAFSAVLYLLLQLVFLGTVPGADLVHGWHGVSFSSPYAEIAVSLNLSWLSWVLYADAIGSPGGSALAFTATTGRESFAMAKNGFLPAAFVKVHGRSGIPRRALVINFVIGIAFLIPLDSWQQIVAATGVLGLIAYALPAVSSIALARAGSFRGAPRWLKYLAPLAFVLATMIVYWAGWHELRIALPVLLVGAVVYAYQQWRSGEGWRDAWLGAWLVVYLALVLVVSAIGSTDFGGTGVIPAPWDTVVVAVIGLGAWAAGVRNGVLHLAAHPAPEPEGQGGEEQNYQGSFGITDFDLFCY